MLRRVLLGCTLAAICSVSSVWAQETMRVRGTVEKVEGSTLYVKTRNGDDLKITLTYKPMFTAIVKASLADIKPGSFVGSGAMPGPDGTLKAIEVHIFPESMRGTGEGHRPWDGGSQSTMTNANVETAVGGVDGQVLTLKYKDGEKKLLVTPETPVVTYAPGDAADVKAGTKVVFAAQKQADGSLQASRISYGKDGLTPPM